MPVFKKRAFFFDFITAATGKFTSKKAGMDSAVQKNNTEIHVPRNSTTQWKKNTTIQNGEYR
jgi:hypothetical protein